MFIINIYIYTYLNSTSSYEILPPSILAYAAASKDKRLIVWDKARMVVSGWH